MAQPNIMALVGNTATLLILLFTTIIYWMIRRDAVKNSHREATQEVYQEWWSDELRELRHYFYREFLPHRPQLLGKSLKEIELSMESDRGRIRKLCYFFERVGWLGAAGLIDVDYILGPLQHSLRAVWVALEPFILEERKPRNIYQVDSAHHFVYLSGFEWLYKRSSQRHQAALIRAKFRKPRLRSRAEIQALREWIDQDEANFRRQLEKM